MAAFLKITMLFLTFTAYAKEGPKFKVRCRKVIHGSFQVEKFDNWQIVSNSMDSELSGISIEKYDKLLPNAVPDNYNIAGKMSGSWNLKGGNFWLTCHHTKMKMVIQQPLPNGLKTCNASEASDAINVECN